MNLNQQVLFHQRSVTSEPKHWLNKISKPYHIMTYRWMTDLRSVNMESQDNIDVIFKKLINIEKLVTM